MAYFAVKDASGATIYIAATGSGSTGDPYVPTHTFTNAIPAGTAVIGKVDQGTGGVSAWKVDGSAVTQPVSIAAAVAVTGTFWQATQPVSIATAPVLVAGSAIVGKVGIDQTTPGTTDSVTAKQGGVWTVQPGNTANTTAWKVDGSAVTQPVSSATLATAANQSTANTSLGNIDTKTPALGQAAAAASVPVVLTAAQLATLTPAATSRVASTADAVVAASNTVSIITYAAAGSGVSHVISALSFGYDGNPTGATLKMEDGSGNIIFRIPITQSGAGFIPFNGNKRGTTNTAMIITLSAGGSGVTGYINATHWTE